MYESLVLISELVLSAYPILIKRVNASVFLQTGVRMAIFSVLAFVAAVVTQSSLSLSGSNVIMSGLLNLLHVGSSYTAFEALPAGNAMSLFYTYPITNLLGAAWVLGERIPTSSLPWMGIAMIGSILVAQPTGKWSLFGVLAALTAALTETGIYLWFRKQTTTEDQPWKTMLEMYGGSGLLWMALIPLVLLWGTSTFQTSSRDLMTMVLFNALVGFVGYGMRFFTIPHVSTVAFSLMSFFGIVGAYLLGWMFVGEVPTWTQGLGAVAIMIANGFLLRKENV
jgi:drug/metabolite transporter (DMT)-like permease